MPRLTGHAGGAGASGEFRIRAARTPRVLHPPLATPDMAPHQPCPDPAYQNALTPNDLRSMSFVAIAIPSSKL